MGEVSGCGAPAGRLELDHFKPPFDGEARQVNLVACTGYGFVAVEILSLSLTLT